MVSESNFFLKIPKKELSLAVSGEETEKFLFSFSESRRRGTEDAVSTMPGLPQNKYLHLSTSPSQNWIYLSTEKG